ncbi:MAG: DUF4230 domain-containing protein [Verrucomicrobiales bacterium]
MNDDLRQPGRGGGRILAFFLGLSLFMAVCAGCVYFFFAKPMVEMNPLERVAEALGKVTQGQGRVSGSSVVLESSKTRELAVIQRKTQSVVKYETKWFKSTKTLVVRGEFLVKVGFDLSDFEGFELSGGKVVGKWPEAEILSVEFLDYEILYSDEGLINKVQDADHEAVVNLLKKQARQDAEESRDVLREAEELVKQRLEDLSGQEVELQQGG